MKRIRRESFQGDAREEQYLHVGLDHIAAIGDASASLGLISTLVLGIGVDSVMQMDRVSHAWKHLFLTLGISFSCYTTIYSLLEYYYVQTLRGVDTFMASRVLQPPARDPLPAESEMESPREESGLSAAEDPVEAKGSQSERHSFLERLATPVHISKRGSTGIMEDRARLMQEVESGCASFNNMRMWARNSMWSSLMCILAATIVKIDPCEGSADDVPAVLKTAAFFLVMTTCAGLAMVTGFTSRDIQVYFATSVIGMATCAAMHFSASNAVPLDKEFASLFLLVGIVVVPLTVKQFRAVFMPLITAHTIIH